MSPALSSQGGWRSGRATYYGEKHDGTDDGFSIHHGSCQFGSLDPDVGTGWDIAALPDVHPEYQGSCGCCGDMDHFDMSMYAFEKIGAMNKGVIGIKYRPVPCPGADEMFVATPPEALTMPPFPSNNQGVSNIKNVRKAIKEASGDAVVISEVGQVVEAPEKPSGEVKPEETPDVIKDAPGEAAVISEGDQEAPEKPTSQAKPEENPDEKRTSKVQWKPVMIRPKVTGDFKPKSGKGSTKDDLAKTISEGTKSNEDGKDKDPSSGLATGPSILLAAMLIV
ncbi:hypothetical protein BSKO_11778 [Bryopsis sp. KO-2023]|nr:hypothetical protein BSKO_11778 [Bryopsis sp. KO-2023]